MISKIKLFLFLFNSEERMHLSIQSIFKDKIFMYDGPNIEKNTECVTIKISKNFEVWKKGTKILIAKYDK